MSATYETYVEWTGNIQVHHPVKPRPAQPPAGNKP